MASRFRTLFPRSPPIGDIVRAKRKQACGHLEPLLLELRAERVSPRIRPPRSGLHAIRPRRECLLAPGAVDRGAL